METTDYRTTPSTLSLEDKEALVREYTIEVGIAVLEADTLQGLSEKIRKAESQGGKIKRLFALVVNTSNVPQEVNINQ